MNNFRSDAPPAYDESYSPATHDSSVQYRSGRHSNSSNIRPSYNYAIGDGSCPASTTQV